MRILILSSVFLSVTFSADATPWSLKLSEANEDRVVKVLESTSILLLGRNVVRDFEEERMIQAEITLLKILFTMYLMATMTLLTYVIHLRETKRAKKNETLTESVPVAITLRMSKCPPPPPPVTPVEPEFELVH
jgi:hypothetical protein